MTAAALIRALQALPPDTDVMVLDSFNGGGHPREINLGPTPHLISANDAEASADCEQRVGEKVFVLGYGCY